MRLSAVDSVKRLIFTFSRNGVAFPGADGDGSGFGQVSACPPNLYLDIA